MSSLILPSRFRQQPQYKANVNADIVTLGSEIWLPSIGKRSLLEGRTLTDVSGGATLSVGSQGKNYNTAGYNQNGGTGGGLDTGKNYTDGVTNLTVFVLFKSYDSVSSSGYGCVFADSRVQISYHHANSTFQNCLALNTDGGWTSAKFETPAAGTTYFWLATIANTAIKSYTNGIETNSSTAPGSRLTGGGNNLISTHPGGYSFNGEVYLSGIIPRVLSNTEIKWLADNPWQIFKAPPRFFFAPSSGATAYTLPADSGTFALTGTDATLARSRILTADAASFALTGTAATLAKGRVVAADSGAFALTGTAATLTRGRVLAADSGTFALTGTAAVLEYTPVGGPTYTLTADPADFALTGTAAVLAHGHVLSADSNSIVLTGTDVTLTYTVPPSGEVTLSAQTISDIADAVYARFLLGAAPVNVIQFNGNPFNGTGRPGDPVTAV